MKGSFSCLSTPLGPHYLLIVRWSCCVKSSAQGLLSTKVNATPIGLLLVLALFICSFGASSCCSRPYAVGLVTWPKAKEYPSGPYQYLLKAYRVQTGVCPGAKDIGTRVSVSIWDHGENNCLFRDSFTTKDCYFVNLIPKWAKCGDVLIVDKASGTTIRRYNNVAPGRWQ